MFTDRKDALLKRTLSACIICVTLASCGGNEPAGIMDESPAAAIESDISSSANGSVVSASAIATTNEDILRARSESLIKAQSERAFELYAGELGEITLTANTAGMFASAINSGWIPEKQNTYADTGNEHKWTQLPWYLLRKLPLIGFLPNANNINPASGKTSCDQRGSATFTLAPRKNTDGYVHLHVLYDNCLHTNTEFEYHGEVELILKMTPDFSYTGQKPDYTDSSINHWSVLFEDIVIAYHELSIRRGERGVVIDGVLEWPKTNFCGQTGAMNTTLLVTDQLTEQQILIDDVQSGWRSVGNEAYNSCKRDTYYPNYLAGDVYIASEGKVSAETNSWYVKNSFHSLLRNTSFTISSNDTRAVFEEIDNPEEQYAIDGNATDRVVDLTVFDRTGNEIDNIQVVPNMVEAGAMIDLGDADSDGIRNSWEVVAGLNPHDAGDAHLDLDSDGVSNYVEFLSRGDPDNSLVRGFNFDAELVFRVAEVVYKKNYRHDIQYHYSLFGNGYMDPLPNQLYLVMSPDKPGTWKTYDKYQCRVNLQSSALECAERVGERIDASFTPDESGLLTMTTTVFSGKYDFFPENNTHTVAVDFQH